MVVGNKSLNSRFLVMEGMTDEVTIGNDCLELLGYKLIETDQERPFHQLSNVTHREMLTPEKEFQLNSLLEAELQKCTQIKGCTTLAKHRIFMKTDETSYFPKNPTMRNYDFEIEHRKSR